MTRAYKEMSRWWTTGYNQYLPDPSFVEALSQQYPECVVRWNDRASRWEILEKVERRKSFDEYLVHVMYSEGPGGEYRPLGAHVFESMAEADMYRTGRVQHMRMRHEARRKFHHDRTCGRRDYAESEAKFIDRYCRRRSVI